MIYGTGIDIIEIERVAAVWKRQGQRFLDRVYTPLEQERCLVGAPRAQWEKLAARFAAKEAVMKTLGTGWRQGVRWRDIEIRHESSGKPYVCLWGASKELAAARGIGLIHISLSHSRKYAIASAVALKRASEVKTSDETLDSCPDAGS
ncbi:MAG: holo-ACP synthase [Firmicutes bacterium]|nr:holo-ACP synthase [Bacillota bacterium]